MPHLADTHKRPALSGMEMEEEGQKRRGLGVEGGNGGERLGGEDDEGRGCDQNIK